MTEKPSKVLIIGSGLIVSGQGAEFGYTGAQAGKAMREAGLNLAVEPADGRKKETI